MTMEPPGRAKAFGTEELSTSKRYGRFGRWDAFATRIPSSRTYCTVSGSR
jgi:hypothetical protein